MKFKKPDFDVIDRHIRENSTVIEYFCPVCETEKDNFCAEKNMCIDCIFEKEYAGWDNWCDRKIHERMEEQ